MATITYFTSKENLIQMLISESSKKETLVLDVQKLPHFLANQIGFSVFEYQISGYPRSIVWTSFDSEILNQLSSFGANVGSSSNNSLRAKVQNSDLFEKLQARVGRLRDSVPATNVVLDAKDEVPDFLKVSNTMEEVMESVDDGSLSKEQTQNFDEWIQKINQTKSVLDSLKNQPQKQEARRPKAVKLLIAFGVLVFIVSAAIFFTQLR